MDCFDAYQRHFGTSLELSELRVESIEELMNKPNLKTIIMVRHFYMSSTKSLLHSTNAVHDFIDGF